MGSGSESAPLKAAERPNRDQLYLRISARNPFQNRDHTLFAGGSRILSDQNPLEERSRLSLSEESSGRPAEEQWE